MTVREKKRIKWSQKCFCDDLKFVELIGVST